MVVVAPNLPEVRPGAPMEDVESVTFGEHLCPVTIDGDPVVGAHVVAELICVEVRGPGPTRSSAAMLPGEPPAWEVKSA